MDGPATTPGLSDIQVLPGLQTSAARKQNEAASSDLPHASLGKTCEDYQAANAQGPESLATEIKASGPPSQAGGDASIETDIRETQALLNLEAPPGATLKPIAPDAFRAAIAQIIEELQQM